MNRYKRGKKLCLKVSPLERSVAERKGHRAPEAKLGKRNSGSGTRNSGSEIRVPEFEIGSKVLNVKHQ